MNVEVYAPSRTSAGDLMGDLNWNAAAASPAWTTRGAMTIIKAQVPMSESSPTSST